jgi:hypothetical protein
MGFLIVVLFLLAAGPVLGIGALVADAHSGGPPLTSRRLMISAVTGGVLLAAPAGCLFSVLPHVTGVALPLGLALGAAYGLVAGLTALGVRRLRVGDRDREQPER